MGNIKCYHKTGFTVYLLKKINKQSKKKTVVKIHESL